MKSSVALLFALLLLCSPAATASGAFAAIRECGAFNGVRFVPDDDMKGAGVYNITTRVATCRRARKIVRRYWNDYSSWCHRSSSVCEIGWGFTCRRTPLGEEYSDARCTGSRGRVVRFQYGA
jgi:hypothetical protein